MFHEREMLDAYNPVKGRTTRLCVEKESDINLGTEEKVRVQMLVANKKGEVGWRRVSMVVKEVMVFGRFNRAKYQCLDNSEMFYANWILLKRIGIPTIPTVRILDSGRVLMTDLTVDGGMCFGKESFLNQKNRFEHMSQKPIEEMELIFAQLDMVAVSEEAMRVACLAAQHDIALPLDDPLELVVHPDGSWEVLILDLGWVEEGNPEKDTDSRNRSKAFLFGSALSNLQEKYLRCIS